MKLFFLEKIGFQSSDQTLHSFAESASNSVTEENLLPLSEEDYAIRREALTQVDLEAELYRIIPRKKKSRFRHVSKLQVAATGLIVLTMGAVMLYWIYGKDRENYTGSLAKNTGISVVDTISYWVGGNGTKEVLSGTEGEVNSAGQFRTHGNTLFQVGLATADTLQLYVGRGKTYRLVLSDGTSVMLNSGSKLTFPSAFDSSARRVRLEGEALLAVKNDRERPFFVEMEGWYTVKVTGTVFNVRYYPDDTYSQTTLVSGSVEILQPHKPTVSLAPSQQFERNSRGDEAVHHVDPQQFTAWSQGWLWFHQESLANALREIGRNYNMDFDLSSVPLHGDKISGKVKRFEDPEILLKMLSKTFQVDFHREGNHYVVRKK